MRQGHAINALIAVMDHNMILVVKIRDLPVITGALHHFSDQHLAITTPAFVTGECSHPVGTTEMNFLRTVQILIGLLRSQTQCQRRIFCRTLLPSESKIAFVVKVSTCADGGVYVGK